MEYIHNDVVELLHERLKTENIQIRDTLSQINDFIESIEDSYKVQDWPSVAVELRKLSDFTKSIFKIDNSSSITGIQTTQKWSEIFSIENSKSLRQVNDKLNALEENSALEELDAVRDYANLEMHPHPYKKRISIAKEDLPNAIAVNFVLKVAIEGACLEEPAVHAIEMKYEWAKIFDPLKITDKAREELEKPHVSEKNPIKIPLDSFRERKIIADELIQLLFNGKPPQYIEANNPIITLLKAFWDTNWVQMRKIIRTQITVIKKVENPQKWYQLSLSEAWIFLQLNKKDKAINIWEDIVRQCPKTLRQIRKIALMQLNNHDWKKSNSEERNPTNTERMKQLAAYANISLVDETIRFDKASVISTINEEFRFKYKGYRTLGEDNREFFIYYRHLGNWINTFSATVERGVFFILPELLNDLLEISVIQQQYYPRVDQYFYRFYKIGRSIAHFNHQNIENYLDLLPLWDLQNNLEDIQNLIKEILEDSSWAVIDIKLLNTILPILTNEQKTRIIRKTKSFIESPKVNEKDTYLFHALYEEYLRLYFRVLRSYNNDWDTEQKWIVEYLLKKEQVSRTHPLTLLLSLFATGEFFLNPSLLEETIDFVNSYEGTQWNPFIEYDRIESISILYLACNQILPLELQEDFKKYPTLWLFNNSKVMPPITEADIETIKMHLQKLIKDFRNTVDSKFLDSYDDLPSLIGQYIRLVLEFYQGNSFYDQKRKAAIGIWDEFLKSCNSLPEIRSYLFINIQLEAIGLAKEIENNLGQIHLLHVSHWHNRLTDRGRVRINEESIKEISLFLEKILCSIFSSKQVTTYEFQYLLATTSWYKYFHCKQALVFWQNGVNIPEDIKTILKIKMLDLICISRNVPISSDIITVYETIFKDSADIQELIYLKDKCAYPLFYEITKNIKKEV